MLYLALSLFVSLAGAQNGCRVRISTEEFLGRKKFVQYEYPHVKNREQCQATAQLHERKTPVFKKRKVTFEFSRGGQNS